MTDDDRQEERLLADLVKMQGYFAGRAGQWRTVGQTVAGTHLPPGRVYAALDRLVEAGFLTKENEHPTPAGTTTPAWIRLDPATTTAAAR